MSFHVGQLVVCVRLDDKYPPVTLRKGAIYTITNCWPVGGKLGVSVAEADPGKGYSGYYADRFRPVDENRLSIFRKMLAPAPPNTVDA